MQSTKKLRAKSNIYMTLETLPPRKKGLDWDRFIKDEDEMREFEKKWKW